MSDLLAECDWHDSTLFLVLPEDPERIGVRLFPSRHAPSRVYVPEAEIVRTKAENAKLRELFSSYWKRVHCPAAPTIERDYLAEMRELGIEVDE